MGKKLIVSEEKVRFNPIDITINFDNYSELVIEGHEVLRCYVTGTFNNKHKIAKGNIVLSKVQDFKSISTSLEYVDFKNSKVTTSNFTKTSFDFGAFINCDFHDSKFIDCTFKNLSITGCDFIDVTFIDCDLTHMVIESCKFYNCTFKSNRTSNKLFEMSLFYETKFINTDIQLATIIDNFGLIEDNLHDCSIRSKTIYEDYENLDKAQIINSRRDLSVLSKIKIDYFYSSELLKLGSSDLDKAFLIETWLDSAQIPSTFNNQIKLFYSFLTENYNNNNCSLFLLLKLHSLTSSLSNNEQLLDSVMTAVLGIHMRLSRIVEDFFLLLGNMSNSNDLKLDLLVKGPLDIKFYEDRLDFLLTKKAKVIKVIKHNSPNELWLELVNTPSLYYVLAIVLSSRLKLEIKRHKNNLIDTDNSKSSDIERAITKVENATNNLPTKSSFMLNLGIDENDNHLYGLKLKSIFPGKLMFELGIHLSTKHLSSLRDIIVEILQTTKSRAS